MLETVTTVFFKSESENFTVGHKSYRPHLYTLYNYHLGAFCGGGRSAFIISVSVLFMRAVYARVHLLLYFYDLL